jgi:hypothetical protein
MFIIINMFTILRDKFHIKFQGKWYFSKVLHSQLRYVKELYAYNGLDCSEFLTLVSRSNYSHSFFKSCDTLEHTLLDKITIKTTDQELELYEEYDSTVIKFLEISQITKYLGIE